jgi:quinolinate synthase
MSSSIIHADKNSKHAISAKILKLKKEKSAVLLAHYYQESSIQDLADFVGDSLALSQRAAETQANIIVFAGVHFMAETAKILNPSKKVLLPDLNAGCSLSDSCPPEAFSKFVLLHPKHVVVSYINCSAEVKAMSDIICTSSNAVKIIQSIPEDREIIFAPDKNLGNYLMSITGRKMLLWEGACVVHEAFSLEKLGKLILEHPEAKLLVHPESEMPVLKMAHFVGSTKALLDFAGKDNSNKYLVATEAGILHQMMKAYPTKHFIPVPVAEENSCACSECAFMKVNTLEKLYNCLLYEKPEILLDEDIRRKALVPLERMLEISNQSYAV